MLIHIHRSLYSNVSALNLLFHRLTYSSRKSPSLSPSPSPSASHSHTHCILHRNFTLKYRYNLNHQHSLTMPTTASSTSFPSTVKLTYPSTKRVPTTDTYNDTEVTEYYRWLEEPDAVETQEWVKQQQ